MAAKPYVIKGAGWEVRISPYGVCDVAQLDRGQPVTVKAADMVSVGWCVVRCLRCGEEIQVRPELAPVCGGCRE